MSQLQRARFETISGLAFLFQVLKAVSKRGNAVFRREIQESRHGRLTYLRGASQRDLILAVELECQFYAHGFHTPKLQHPSPFVMRYLCQRITPMPQGQMTIEEFHRMLAAMAEGSEELPDLPTESFSRESFYEDRPDTQTPTLPG